MAGSSFGTIFRLTTWGESHGKGVGVVVDGVPAGLSLSEEDIQVYLDRRKPGQNRFTTKRKESDTVQILSGTFEGKTTGTPISMVVWNEDQHSKDYSDIASYYRPGHADYTFDAKYGFRDYRGGGRSSGRETIARVAAGAIALKMLSELGITVSAYTRSIGDVEIQSFDTAEIANNALCAEVFCHTADTGGLHTGDCRFCHGCGKARVFGVALLTSSPSRVARHIERRHQRQIHMTAL